MIPFQRLGSTGNQLRVIEVLELITDVTLLMDPSGAKIRDTNNNDNYSSQKVILWYQL